MSIIDELWYGNIVPNEEIRFKGDHEYDFALNQLGESQEKLMESLNEEQKALCEEYIKRNDALSCFLERAAFRKGFCLGIKIMEEVPEE